MPDKNETGHGGFTGWLEQLEAIHIRYQQKSRSRINDGKQNDSRARHRGRYDRDK